ncbi:lipopolysaccharide biosynthesis protein [Bryobacter aggregatus]|uniref:lipopolysaccharide biosynthesis protein n=1 Tax=Bryobacter aggregatus TaxID=360054 RepID=UPI00138E552B|nr:oligosaccharide flippase family protein [Bryobacter aggregatus]
MYVREPISPSYIPTCEADKAPISCVGSSPGIAKNIYWVVCSQIAYAGSQWFFLWLLARYTGPSGVGAYAFGLAVAAPALMFAGLQLRALQATDTKNQFLSGDYLTLRLLGTFSVLAIFMALSCVTWKTNGAVIFLLGAGKCLEAISDGLHGFLHRMERLDLVSRSVLVKAASMAVLGGLSIWITADVRIACAAVSLSFFLTLIFYDVPLYKRIKAESGNNDPHLALRPSALRNLIWLGLPLGYVQLLVSLGANAPRYFLEKYYGEADLGIFAAMAYLIVVGQTLISAAGQSASPLLARLHTSGDIAAFRALMHRMLWMAVGVGGMGVLVALSAGVFFLTLLYGDRFAVGAPVLPVIMLAATALYVAWLLGFGLTAVREIKSQAYLLTLSTVVSLGASWILIGRYGLVGAGWAMFSGGAVQATGAGVLLHFALRARVLEGQR